jgi:hypothetical protein
MLQHLEGLPVGHLGHAIRYRRYAVVKKRLPDRNIDHLLRPMAQTMARRERHNEANQSQKKRVGAHAPSKEADGFGEAGEHNSWRCLEDSTAPEAVYSS